MNQIILSFFNSIRALAYLCTFTIPSIIGIAIFYIALYQSDQGQDILLEVLVSSEKFPLLAYIASLIIFSLSNWLFSKKSLKQNKKPRLALVPSGQINRLFVKSSIPVNDQLLTKIRKYNKNHSRILAYLCQTIGTGALLNVGINKDIPYISLICWGYFTFSALFALYSLQIAKYIKHNFRNIKSYLSLTIFILFLVSIIIFPFNFNLDTASFLLLSISCFILNILLFTFLTIRTLFVKNLSNENSLSKKNYFKSTLIGSLGATQTIDGKRRFGFQEILNLLIIIIIFFHILNNLIFQLPCYFGPIFTFMFGLISLVSIFNLISSFLRNNFYTPSFLFIIFILFMISLSGKSDYYQITNIPSEINSNERQSFSLYINNWLTRKIEIEKDTSKIRLIASYGGGIRASYWTNLVLSKFQDQDSTFHKNTLALTGSSGGMIGTGIFNLTGREQPNKSSMQNTYDIYKKRDFISSNIARLTGLDIIGGLIGFNCIDRHESIEKELSDAVDHVYGNSLNLELPFLKHWNVSKRRTPLLLATSTNIRTGNYSIYSPVKLDSPKFSHFLDIYGIKNEYFDHNSQNYWDVPYMTAICQSARFPYISPPGHFGNANQFVDAGYFDNFGGDVIYNVLSEVIELLDKKSDNDLYKNVKIELVIINSSVKSDSLNYKATMSNEMLAPVTGFFNSWNRHTTNTEIKITSLQKENINRLTIKKINLEKEIKREKEQLILPLGWHLSTEALNSMYKAAETINLDF